ncbi:methylated-DNA--[protein]-cysteine S-methyltransferase [Paludibacterium yongneupense]|uniref:methylated-DNA--[protein]-cysteine S-methyltransferase n=1 Tax=Paludibacterium yongneupense TaxID=400061 RepID=UPI0003F4C11C|nr:methylated-DNA--[protein]-cysteine S-methyltransferase [Paludibacterium yongneupense]
MQYSAVIATPLCRLGILTRADALLSLSFVDAGTALHEPVAGGLEAEVARQIACYFADPRYVFNLPLHPVGTDFQLRVWRAIARIPVGETRCYREVASEVGSIARAVGGACGRNPLPIIVPCHRVVAAAGPGGFNRGQDRLMMGIKLGLLRHEYAG